MANISNEIAVISTATYGEQVRNAICDAITKINTERMPSGDSIVAGNIVPLGYGRVLSVIAGTVSQESGV